MPQDGTCDVIGQVWEEDRNTFVDGNLKVERKLPRQTSVICGVAKSGLIEAVDKAVIGFSDDSWGTLDDFINIFTKSIDS